MLKIGHCCPVRTGYMFDAFPTSIKAKCNNMFCNNNNTQTLNLLIQLSQYYHWATEVVNSYIALLFLKIRFTLYIVKL